MKRVLAFLMSVVLVVGLLPEAAFAQIGAAKDVLQIGYDVSNGQYGPYDTVRRMYTRPLTLTPAESGVDEYSRTPAIDLQNEVYDGADFAVRYTGAKPYLVFTDENWKGWTTLYQDICTVEDEVAHQKVTFFSRAAAEERWAQYGGKQTVNDKGETVGPYDCDWMFVCVSSSANEECNIVEVVALDGDVERVDPTKSPNYHEKTGLTRDEIAKDMRAGYNLAGHFEANYVPPNQTRDGGWGKSELMQEAHWTRGVYVTRDTIANLKKEGFNAIRIPVTWFQHIYPVDDPTGDSAKRTDLSLLDRYHVDRAWLERVHEVVDWCIAEDMYAIVNIHHEDWIDRPDLATAYDETDLPDKFKAVWTQIANEFKGYDQHLVFEDMNEPHAWIPDPETGKSISWGYASEGSVRTVNRLNADFVKLMRNELDGHAERLLMLSHDTGGGEVSYTGFVMPEDKNDLLAISMHSYTPHNWTHYFAEGNHADEDGALNVYTDSYRNEVDATWESHRSRYTSQGYTVILGEFGCYYYGGSAERQQDRLDWMTQYATHAKELGIPLFYWRMDRTVEVDGVEHVGWSAFDEEAQQLSPLSSHLFENWFSILKDDSIAWGSNAEAVEGEHADLATGMQLGESKLPATVVSRQIPVQDGYYVRFAGTWEDVKGKEVAVEFTGNVPRLQAFKNWKGDYWGLAPDTVDYRKGIAYYSSSSIETRWKAVIANTKEEQLIGATVDDINYLGVCTADSGSETPTDKALTTTVKSVAVVHQHEWGSWERAAEPTCAKDGAMTRTCAHDSTHKLIRLIPAAGHAWNAGKVTTPAGPVKAGVLTYTCANCGETRTEPIPATGRLKMADAKVSLSSSSLAYNGSDQKPTVTVKSSDGKRTLKADADYKLTYWRGAKETKDFKNVGTITVKVAALSAGDYTGSKTVTYKITAKSITPAVALSKTSVVYTGKALKPAVTVWVDSRKKTKVPTAGYSVVYKGNTNPGKATVTVTAKGNYTFKAKSLSFTINPKATKLTRLAKAKKGFTANWAKQTAQTSGYQLQYALKSNFKSGAKSITISNAKTTKRKVTGLKAGKAYWVHVRTFKTVSGKKYYSSWSSARKVVTKK